MRFNPNPPNCSKWLAVTLSASGRERVPDRRGTERARTCLKYGETLASETRSEQLLPIEKGSTEAAEWMFTMGGQVAYKLRENIQVNRVCADHFILHFGYPRKKACDMISWYHSMENLRRERPWWELPKKQQTFEYFKRMPSQEDESRPADSNIMEQKLDRCVLQPPLLYSFAAKTPTRTKETTART